MWLIGIMGGGGGGGQFIQEELLLSTPCDLSQGQAMHVELNVRAVEIFMILCI